MGKLDILVVQACHLCLVRVLSNRPEYVPFVSIPVLLIFVGCPGFFLMIVEAVV